MQGVLYVRDSMRNEHDIRSMIDYLAARDPQHPDISILKWVLGESPKSVWELRFEEATKAYQDAGVNLNAIIQKQNAEIVDLKEKLKRFVTPVQRAGQ